MYILWPENGLKQRPKHVVNLNKQQQKSKLCCDLRKQTYCFAVFYIAFLNNYMFRPLYRPSSDYVLSYYKANYTVYNVSVSVNEISYISKEFAFKMFTIAVEQHVIVKASYVEHLLAI
jgi:hypothetical protein